MSEMQRSEIIYEEGWREAAPLSDEELPPDETQTGAVSDTENSGHSRPLLIMLRLAVCLLAALVLFLLKAMDSEGYYSFMDYYREELSKPVVSQELFSAAELGRFFTPNAVSIQATPDEAAHRED